MINWIIYITQYPISPLDHIVYIGQVRDLLKIKYSNYWVRIKGNTGNKKKIILIDTVNNSWFTNYVFQCLNSKTCWHSQKEDLGS